MDEKRIMVAIVVNTSFIQVVMRRITFVIVVGSEETMYKVHDRLILLASDIGSGKAK
jgi:hypothetical protein